MCVCSSVSSYMNFFVFVSSMSCMYRFGVLEYICDKCVGKYKCIGNKLLQMYR